MRKTTVAALAFGATMAAFSFAAPANAQSAYDYKWCAYYSGVHGGGTNCYFSTRGQCMAAISGVGGICQPNPWYASAHYGDRPAKRRYRRDYY